MNSKHTYRTTQKEQIRQYLHDHPGRHMTARQLCDALQATGGRISLPTVYRHLEKMVSEGTVARFTADESGSSCYAFVDGEQEHAPDCHCMCTNCGRLIHMPAAEITALQRQLAGHAFALDPYRTVFYGLCSDCQTKRGNHR